MTDLRLAYLCALGLILALPYLIWRLARRPPAAPLVVVQIGLGVLLGPAGLGRLSPELHGWLFGEAVISLLSGMAWWGVMVFVMLAGLELELQGFWQNRKETAVTSGLALLFPLLFGSAIAVGLLTQPGWIGSEAAPWQFVLGIGMASAVTALPILVLFLEQLRLLATPLGQRVVRYASVEDLFLWSILALLLMDWSRLIRELLYLLLLAIAGAGIRTLVPKLAAEDRWPVALIWLLVCAAGADYAGFHFIVGAFLAGAVLESGWFQASELNALRRHVLLLLMPVFFLLTGLRTHWQVEKAEVFMVALAFLIAGVGGKFVGVFVASRWLGWPPGEWRLVAWLLQTKALILIIFITILLDRAIISPNTFSACLLSALVSTGLTLPMVMRGRTAPKSQRI